MESELTSTDAVQLQNQIIVALQRQISGRYKCIFLNSEMRATAGGLSISGDLFAVTKPFLGRPQRKQFLLEVEALTLLDRLEESLLRGQTNRDHIIVDFIIWPDGKRKVFLDDGPLRRLGGGDGFFKAKHKSYVYLEPLFGEVS